ncbi:MAG TPA: 23S rRNA (pseudouridine(1915)-N(3))-methyltransferase RlmH [Candidatus Aquilonibacter sp.]|nr:23S rRNA (pseudouridine(1915)-N(3))-methyltransferase RlmH [Candidatus Aquilonibacter sp.]
MIPGYGAKIAIVKIVVVKVVVVKVVLVKIKVAWVGKTKEPAIRALTEEYVRRISRYVQFEAGPLRDEVALVQMAGRAPRNAGKIGRSEKSTLVLMDSRGQQLSSEEFARFLGDYQDRNPLPLVLAIGPADGFSDAALTAAQRTISLSKMTLAHELARVVLLEQLYRAFTILKNHPYHSGH